MSMAASPLKHPLRPLVDHPPYQWAPFQECSNNDFVASTMQPPTCHTSPDQQLSKLLADLPPELQAMVYKCIIDGSRYAKPHEWARLSLVCRDWSRIFRSLLFRRLSLQSGADVEFVLNMLRNQRDGWLSAVVEELSVDRGLDFDHVCRTFVKQLPSIRRLSLGEALYSRLDATDQAFHIPDTRTAIFKRPIIKPSLRFPLANYANLLTFHLSEVRFQSFSVLARLLGAMPNLQFLTVSHVSWLNSEIDEHRPPSRMTNLDKLREVTIADTTPDYWLFLWLLSPSLAGRAIVPPAGDSTTKVLVLLAKALNAATPEGLWLKSMYHPLENICCLTATAIITISLHAPQSDGGRPALRSVELHLRGDPDQSPKAKSKWNTVDRLLSEARGFVRLTWQTDLSWKFEEVARRNFPRLSEQDMLRILSPGQQIFPKFPSGQGVVVPQAIFRTPANQGAFVPKPTIRFYDSSTGLHGIPLANALRCDYTGLADLHTRPYTTDNYKLTVRIQWPGYSTWADAINTREAGGAAVNQLLTKGRLATEVARKINDFYRDMSTVASSDRNPSWWLQNMLVQGLVLLEFRNVSQGSWQPVIVWRGIQ